MSSDDAFSLLTTINDKNIFSYRHNTGENISGSYEVSSFDINGNEGEKVCYCSYRLL